MAMHLFNPFCAGCSFSYSKHMAGLVNDYWIRTLGYFLTAVVERRIACIDGIRFTRPNIAISRIKVFGIRASRNTETMFL